MSLPSAPSPVAEIISAPKEGSASVPETVSQPLSKNAQKRLLKAQRREECKAERRAHEKALKKAKKAERREKRARGELDDDEDEKARQVKRQKLPHDGPKEKFGARLVIDLGFDDKMTDRVSLSFSKYFAGCHNSRKPPFLNRLTEIAQNEQEVVSLVSQCAYSYSSNRKSLHPFKYLLFTSLNGRTYRRFEVLKTYRQWKNVEWWDQGYERLWRSEDAPESMEPLTSSGKGHAEPSNSSMLASKVSAYQPCEGTPFCPDTQHSQAPKSSVVYLTADSPDELLELNEGETYIVGGICDKNRYKVGHLAPFERAMTEVLSPESL